MSVCTVLQASSLTVQAVFLGVAYVVLIVGSILVVSEHSSVGVAHAAAFAVVLDSLACLFFQGEFVDKYLFRELFKTFDCLIVMVSAMLVVGFNAALIKDIAPSFAALIVLGVGQIVIQMGLLCLGDASPAFYRPLSTVTFALVWVALVALLIFWFVVSKVENDVVACVEIMGQQCQSMQGARRSAMVQLVLFYSKFVAKSWMNPEQSVLLRAPLSIKVVGARNRLMELQNESSMATLAQKSLQATDCSTASLSADLSEKEVEMEVEMEEMDLGVSRRESVVGGLSAGWNVSLTDQGIPYYFNENGTTQWDKPVEEVEVPGEDSVE